MVIIVEIFKINLGQRCSGIDRKLSSMGTTTVSGLGAKSKSRTGSSP